ncbi:MAG: recombinase family protein [Burkholderiaceae bacterium]|nr:recombinase family protein [Burkholderiaceae bacterium]MDP3424435.1 recombinase family protein [Burkholderiaceae bacterium]
MLIGYARVSTTDQDTALQLDALKRAGVKKIYAESCSGISTRPQLQTLLHDMPPGAVLVVWKIDRIARSLPDLLHILQRLKTRRVGLRSLTEPLDTSTPIGEFMLQILGAVAQLERAMIRERVIAGQVAAIQRGQRHGRPSSINETQKLKILEMFAADATRSHIARELGVSRWAVCRVIGQAQDPNHPKYGPHRPVLGPLLDNPKS